MTIDSIAEISNSPEPLTYILRSGARRLIEQAVEADLAALLGANAAGVVLERSRGSRPPW